MTGHDLFYFPYASLTNDQLPLLKVAALYFDRLTLLDPLGASWDTVGVDPSAQNAVRQLQSAGILEVVTPATIMKTYERPIAEAIRRDLRDPAYLELCEAHAHASGKRRWTLSLAKVPQEVETDETLRHLMGDFARAVAAESAGAATGAGPDALEFAEYAEGGQTYDEYREGGDGVVEYRYADYPLAVGEAIMMNHALFAGLLHAEATPITDDAFHSRALAHKLRRATQEPLIEQALADRRARRHVKAGALAAAALNDTDIRLPILDPAVPLDEVLELRMNDPEGLAAARAALASIARRIRSEPWTEDFERELDTQTLPDLAKTLDEARRSRDAWLGSGRTRHVLGAAGIAVGAASAVLAVLAAPATPIALVSAGLAAVSGTAIPGAKWWLDWRGAKAGAEENGLHYLLKTG